MEKEVEEPEGLLSGDSLVPALIEETDDFSSRYVGSIALAHGIHDLYSGFLPPLLPILIEKFSLSNLGGGSLTLFFSLPSLLQPVIGAFADRRNLKIMVSLAPFITGVVMTLLGLTASPVIMMVMLVFAGLSSASLHAIGPALNSKHAGKKLGKGMSFWVNAGTLGYALGALLLVSAYDLVGLSGLPILAILGAIASILIWFGLKGADTSAAASRTQKSTPKDWGNILKIMLPIVFIVATRAMMTAMLSTYFPAFLRERGASTWVSGAGMTLILIAGVFGSQIVGNLSDKFNRIKILAIITIALFSFMMMFLRTDNWLQIPVLLLIGFFEIAALPVLMALVQESFSGDRAFINGLFLSINFVGTSLAVPLVGRLADLYNFQNTFQLAAYILPFGLLGMGWIYRLNKNSQLI
ncbi:MAG: MFS transporter [Anaerolineaceae bacterium]|jgi:FSR family fosmidomycin resistance protein-like MFS transporter|nr:MFS transporter [Anaerolineaceae bacterium]